MPKGKPWIRMVRPFGATMGYCSFRILYFISNRAGL